MIAVADTNIFIKRLLNPSEYELVYITSSIYNELRDEETRNYYEFNKFNIEIKDPSPKSIKIVSDLNKSKNLNLSDADIDIVALTLELSEQRFDVWISKQLNQIKCLSEDNGVKQALSELNLVEGVKEKIWKYRCYTCYNIYDNETIFCKKCGYNTITRVSVSEVDGKMRVNFKKGFVYKKNIIKDKDGCVIKSEDQKEFIRMQNDKRRKSKRTERMIKEFI